MRIRHLAAILFLAVPVYAGWPVPATQPASQPAAAPKVDYYKLTAAEFFKLEAVRAQFVETKEGITADRDLLDAAIFHATNLARVEQKLEPFVYGVPLTAIARQHSDEMVKLQYCEHESPVAEYKTLAERFALGHLKPQTYAENIAMLPAIDAPPTFDVEPRGDGTMRRFNHTTKAEIPPYTYEGFAKAVVQAWMESPHHRANILEPKLKFMAIGATAGDFKDQASVLVTQNFSSDLKQ